MTQVNSDQLKAAIEKIDGLPEEELDQLIDKFTQEQKGLVGYILQAGIEFENEALNVYSVYYFAVMYESFKQADIGLNEISEEAIDAFQEAFHLGLDAIHNDEDYMPMHELCGQPVLMTFLAEELESEDANGESLDDVTKTQLFLVLAGMIGLINGAIKA